MISLTEKEWERNRDEWRESKPVGTKVVVYGRPLIYNKKRTPITVLGKFELMEGGVWKRL